MRFEHDDEGAHLSRAVERSMASTGAWALRLRLPVRPLERQALIARAFRGSATVCVSTMAGR